MFGKLLGAIAGLVVGLLFGSWTAALVLAGVGAFLGHRYDELHQDPTELEGGTPLPRPSPLPEPEPVRGAVAPRTARMEFEALPAPPTRAEVDAQARAHFARQVTALFAFVARADGEVVRDEVRVVREFFEQELGFTPRELDLVRASLKDALARPVDWEAAVEECVAQLRQSERLLLLNALYELALADGDLRRSERDAIRRIAEGLEIRAEDQRAVAALHFDEGGGHYERLGLAPACTDEEVKSAFRRLAAAHHPDRVAHLGEGAVELAGRTFREIKEAYEEIRRRRGW